MAKLNTAQLKQLISAWVDRSPSFQGELNSHDVTDWSPSQWSRTSKVKINRDHLFGDYTEMYEILYDGGVMDDFSECGMAQKPDRPLEQLLGCFHRTFLHKQADCSVGIITDAADEKVVAWLAMID